MSDEDCISSGAFYLKDLVGKRIRQWYFGRQRFGRVVGVTKAGRLRVQWEGGLTRRSSIAFDWDLAVEQDHE